MQNYSLDFDGLLHKMVSKEQFINQEISYINEKGEMNCYSLSGYTTKKQYNRNWERKVWSIKKEKTQIESVTYKLIMSIYGLKIQFTKENRPPQVYNIGNEHHYTGWHISEFFQGLIYWRCYMWKLFLCWIWKNKNNIHHVH